MFKRVMVAVVGIPFLILVLVFAPAWATALLLAAMCGMGAWELMRAVGAWPRKRAAVAVFGGMVPLWLLIDEALLPFLLMVMLVAMFWIAIRRYGTENAVPFSSLTAAVFSCIVFPLMLSCLLRLRLLPGGKALVFVPLCVSFGSDTLALFAGMLFGRRALAPRVSPKKTVEGAVGGLAGGVAGLALFKGVLALLVRLGQTPGVEIGWRTVVILGLFGSAVSQVGDLSFSVIKREFGVKDYGNLLPGHGGVLDRFDSVTFVTPFVWFMFRLLG